MPISAVSYLVPIHRVDFQSPMAPAEVRAHLQSVVETKQHWWHRPVGKEFLGVVDSKGFRIMRIIRGRNTYLPWLLGEVTPTDLKGSRVKVLMILHPIAIFVMLAFFGFALQPSMAPPNLRWLPIGLLMAFHIAMCVFGFVPEARRVEKQLHQLLAAG